MKCTIFVEGSNDGASFLKDYETQEVNIQSLYKDIDINSPPLVEMDTLDDKTHVIQIMDVRIIDEFIFMHCYVTDKEGNGGKALLRLKPTN